MTKKSQNKNLSILKTTKAFKKTQNTLFIIFKGLLLKQIKPIFLKGESPTLKNQKYFKGNTHQI